MIFAKKKQTIEFQEINKNNYQSIIFAAFLVLLPHFFYMPVRLTALIVLVIITWQVLLFKDGHFRSAQNRWLQYLVVCLGLGIIYLNFKTFLGVEAGCSALSLILLGKAFEVKSYRDSIVQFNFALFVAAAAFLYGQSILLAAAVLIAVFSCLYGMYQLQSHNNTFEEVLAQDISEKQLRQQAYKTVFKLLLLATPLMIVLFLFFPRIPPLWSIPTPNSQAKTGISDEMSPGDIANLSQSSALAFRAVFDDSKQMPIKSELYWRAMVLDKFDGIKWTQSPFIKYSPSFRQEKNTALDTPSWYTLKTNSRLVDYKLIIEPTYQSWVYALDFSLAREPLTSKFDLSIQLPYPINRRQQFEFNLITPSPKVNVEIADELKNTNLELPKDINIRSLQFAQALYKQHNENPEQYAQAVLDWIRKENFSYTLSPPLLNGDRIDDFLFRSRAGFCEHYASAYTNLMRMVGIPARVVVGYQGGKLAPDSASWEVRQLDAHAWTEVWFKDKGWIRIDPTAAIAPDRVELGMQDYSQLNNSIFGNSKFSAWSAKQSQWLTQARIWADYANYQWQTKVIGFDQDRQRNWLKKLSIENLSEQLILLILSIVSIIGLVVWWLSRQQKVIVSELDKHLLRFSNQLQKYQLQRLGNEPVLTWLNRIQQEQKENTNLKEIINLYTQHIYIHPLSNIKLNELYKLLRKYTFENYKN